MAGDADKDIIGRNWYEVIGLNLGADEAAIAKAIRKLSSKYHPDKNKTDPKAPELFLLIQKAKEILLDGEKRKIVDDHFASIIKRKEYDEKRDKGMDDRRKRMKMDLETKMKEATNINNIPTQKSSSSSSSKAKEGGESKGKSYMDEDDDLNTQEREKFRAYEENKKPKRLNQIKVKWRKSQISHSDDSLYQLFKTYGTIDHIDLSSHSAIITYKDNQACFSAVDAYIGSPDFRVSLLSAEYKSEQKSNIFTHKYNQNTSNINSSSGISRSVQDMLADDIRRAIEREEYLRKMQMDDMDGVSEEPVWKEKPKTSNIDMKSFRYTLEPLTIEEFNERHKRIIEKFDLLKAEEQERKKFNESNIVENEGTAAMT